MTPSPLRERSIAIVGATGVVGREILSILEKRDVPADRIRLAASERSVGSTVPYGGTHLTVASLVESLFEGVEFAFVSAGASVSREWVPRIAAAGAYVVDNSSAFREDPEIPLCVPEINGGALPGRRSVAAVPNCATIQLVMALEPIRRAAGLRRVVVSTYQSVSGAGGKALDEVQEQTRALLEGESVSPRVFPHPIAFNCIPQIPQSEAFDDDGFTCEERKIMTETRRILGLPDLPIAATCVRVPTFRGHAETVHVETETPLSPEEARKGLAAMPGVVVQDEPAASEYPTPRKVGGRDEVFVGRIRRDPSVAHGLIFWVVADNLRKGAALNAIQIAESIEKGSSLQNTF